MHLDPSILSSSTAEELLLELLTILKIAEDNPDQNPNKKNHIKLNFNGVSNVLSVSTNLPVVCNSNSQGDFSLSVVSWLVDVPSM